MPQLRLTTAAFSNAQVLIRFALRIGILCVFATLGSISFAGSFAALLWMSAMISVVTGLIRREPVFSSTLTYWDEAAAYGALCYLASTLTQAPAS